MKIDEELNEKIKIQISEIELKSVKENTREISKRYRENNATGKKLIKNNKEAVTYAIYRMPSTYCATYSVLKHVLEINKFSIKNCIDIGAGTGAATWAIHNVFDLDKILCLEYQEEMMNIGKKIMENTSLKNVEWEKFNICTDEIKNKSDLIITSYMINELREDEKEKAILKMWNSTNNLLVIIEPGTPNGFKNILKAREILLNNGANMVAPCCNSNKCQIKDDDWCSFYVRLDRSGIQRMVKDGELGYEDEKFSYIVVSKEKLQNNKISRILRHPQINTGFVKVKMCTENGIEEKTISKKMGEIYKKVKKLDAGDII